MLVVTYAWIQSTLLNGLLFAAMIGVGAAVTISLFGGLGMALRSGAVVGFDPEGRRYALLLDALEIASSVVIFLVGLLFFVGSVAV
jgi:ABC-type nickel/cobalt efflux system permease component RcnA